MNPEVETQVAWLGSLTAPARNQFLVQLAHGLTIAIRVLCQPDRDAAKNLESVRLANEASHRVLGYVSHSVASQESQSWLVTVVEAVLCINDEAASQQASQAWSFAKNQLGSASAA